MADEKKEEKEGEVTSGGKSSGTGFLLGAILGVILAVVFGLITVGMLIPDRSQEKEQNGKASKELEIAYFPPQGESISLIFNIGDRGLRKAKADWTFEYKTDNLDEIGNLLQNRGVLERLKSALKRYLKGQREEDLTGGGEMEDRHNEWARKKIEQILKAEISDSEEGVKEPKLMVTSFWFDITVQ